MNKQQPEAFAREAAKYIKTESDLSDFTQMLAKVAIEANFLSISWSKNDRLFLRK